MTPKKSFNMQVDAYLSWPVGKTTQFYLSFKSQNLSKNNLNPPNLLIDRSFIFMICLPLLDNKATFPVYIWSFIFIICLSLLKQQSHFPVLYFKGVIH